MRTLEAHSIFLLLISSLVFLVHGSPTTESTVPNSDDINSIEISTTASVTTNSAPAAPPTPIVSGDKETEKAALSIAGEHPSSEKKEPKVKSPKLLLYEVEKGIRNLSLKDIEYVLTLGNEVFSYSLADKLGYLKNEKDSDPHIKAIADNKQILVKKLEDRKEELKPAVKLPPPPPTTVAPSPQPETPSPPNENRINYDIVKKISQLTIEDIDRLLGIYDVKTLPFALGVDFGYDDDRDTAHLKYLEDRGGENLKTVLLKEKQRKLAEPRPNTPQPQSSRGGAKELGGGGVKIKTPQHTQPQSNRSDAKENWPPGEGEGMRRKVVEVTQGSKEGEKMDADGNRISSPQGTGDNRQGEGNRNDNQPSLPQDGHKDDFDGDNDRPPSFDGDGDEDTWSEDEFEDQLHNVDSDKDQVSNENQSQAGNGKDGGDKGAKEPKENPEKEKDGYARPEDADNKNEPADSGNAKGDAGKESDSGVEEHQKEEEEEEVLEGEDEEATTSGFSFGAWHFLTIFIVIGVGVVIGYLCLHNRKKLREGVGTYISDSNKRRRRAREYKPLVST